MAEAREEAVQEYKNNFNDTVDYLYLMRDAVDEYKMAIKKVDPTFNSDHYDSLIFGEPSTPRPKTLLSLSSSTQLAHRELL